MASSFANSETFGASTTQDATCINLLSTSTASGSDTSTNTAAAPITVISGSTARSYERWIQGHWTGSFTSISNVTFYKYSGTPGTGCSLFGGDKGNATYVTAVNTDSSYATTDSASWDTSGEAFTLGYAAAFSDYVVLQLDVADTASPGKNADITYRWGWDET